MCILKYNIIDITFCRCCIKDMGAEQEKNSDIVPDSDFDSDGQVAVLPVSFSMCVMSCRE